MASLLDLCSQRGGDAVHAAAHRRGLDASGRYRLQTLQTVTTLLDGGDIGSEASLAKVWWSELDIELHEIALDLLGTDAELEGPWSKGHQFSLAGPIYAGTNRGAAQHRGRARPGPTPMRLALGERRQPARQRPPGTTGPR